MASNGLKRTASRSSPRSKAQKTSTEALASFFTPISQKALIKWKDEPNLLSGHFKDPTGQPRISAFDLDGTIIVPKHGKWPKNASDWKWAFVNIVDKIREEHSNGKRIVIVSNQGGFSHSKYGKNRKEEWKAKLQMIVNELNVPISVFASPRDDEFRKPSAGIWTEIVKSNKQIEIDLDESFYVGDAAGREGDHSNVDFGFARNVGISFYVPEEYFEGKPRNIFDPREYTQQRSLFLPADTPLIPLNQTLEIVVFVGPPGIGKTTFYKTYFEPAGYLHVNQDTLKSKERCKQVVLDALEEKKSVVIDNTNPAASTRQEYIQIVQEYNARTGSQTVIRCMHFISDLQLGKHNNMYRAKGHPDEKQRSKQIPTLAYEMFTSRYEVPKLSEGFEEIKKIQFVFRGSDEERNAWMQTYI